MITENRDLPWLQDRDDDQNGQSDVWFDSWNVEYRDVVILDGDNNRFGTFNVTSSDLAKTENYALLRELMIDAAMATQKPWMNPNNPLDINNDGFVHPLDVLLVVNRINAEGTGDLSPPTGSEWPATFYDCNGDNFISPLDVLQIINFLNASSSSGEGEAARSEHQSETTPAAPVSQEIVPVGQFYWQPIASDLPQQDRDAWRWQTEVDRYFAATIQPLRVLHT